MIGNALKHQLRIRNMQQKELAVLSGVTQTQISRYLINQNEPTESSIIKLCNALQITPNDLLEWEDNNRDTNSHISSICLLEGLNREAMTRMQEYIKLLKSEDKFQLKS